MMRGPAPADRRGATCCCLTSLAANAQAQIPKYMAVADRIMEVARQAGATGFLEAAIRDPGVLGNNPDTSVTLRW